VNLKIAKKLSQKSDHTEFKHSCLIVKGGNILASGFNKGKIHAEINAIGRDVTATRFKGATLYSFRFSNRGLANSHPCNNCTKVIAKTGVQKIVYARVIDGIVFMEEMRRMSWTNLK